MALPASGIITFDEIKTEFSGPNDFRAYVRGGSFVANTPANINVATSGTLTMETFYGASSGTANLIMVAGNSSHTTGYDVIGTGVNIGTLTPNTFNGFTISEIATSIDPSGLSSNSFAFAVNTATTQNAVFGKLTFIGGNGNVAIFNANSATTFEVSGGSTFWFYNVGTSNSISNLLISGDTYEMFLTLP